MPNNKFPQVRKILLKQDTDRDDSRQRVLLPPGIPILVLVFLIGFAIEQLTSKKGSTPKEIRRYLVYNGLLPKEVSLRRALIHALREGFISRSKWAEEAGVYGYYVLGAGGIAQKVKTPTKSKKVSKKSSQKEMSKDSCKKQKG